LKVTPAYHAPIRQSLQWVCSNGRTSTINKYCPNVQEVTKLFRQIPRVRVFGAFLVATSSVALLISLFSIWQLPSRSQLRSILQADSASFDFGTVNEGIHKRAITLRNFSRKTVYVNRVWRGCACQEASVPTQIGPNEKAQLEVTWDVRGRHGNTGSKIAIAHCWELEQATDRMPTLLIDLVATVNPDFELSQNSIDFSSTSELSAIVKLIPRNLTVAELVSIETSHPSVRVELTSPTEFRCSYDETNKDTFGEVYVTLHTNSPNSPLIRVPVTLRFTTIENGRAVTRYTR
jgi:hypothetical protein